MREQHIVTPALRPSQELDLGPADAADIATITAAFVGTPEAAGVVIRGQRAYLLLSAAGEALMPAQLEALTVDAAATVAAARGVARETVPVPPATAPIAS